MIDAKGDSDSKDSNAIVSQREETPQKPPTPMLPATWEEEYDANGNIKKVGDLIFSGKTLGTGAYAAVHMAKRDGKRKIIRSDSFPLESLDKGSFNRRLRPRMVKSLVQKSSVNEEYVAVKVYSKSILRRIRNIQRSTEANKKITINTALDSVKKEIALMKMMRHPNIVSLLQVIDNTSDALYVVLEFVPLGEIMSFDPEKTRYIHTHKSTQGLTKDGYFNEENAALFFVDVLHGLAYLHQNCVVHRDLKPENILLGKNGVAKISDFGVSHFFEKESDRESFRSSMTISQDDLSVTTEACKSVDGPPKLTRKDTESALRMNRKNSMVGSLKVTEGTYPFFSPEMCDGTQHFSGYASDLWACGVCLYIFTSGRLPFYSDAPYQLLQIISEGKVPYSYSGMKFSTQLKDLLSKILHRNPSERLGVGDCLQHAFCTKAREKRIVLIGEAIRRSSQTELIVKKEDESMALSIAKVSKRLPSLGRPLKSSHSLSLSGSQQSHVSSLVSSAQRPPVEFPNKISEGSQDGSLNVPVSIATKHGCCNIQ
mmetsp:Transcript_6173/g.9067  ORF Transcript_6173/g.9067 Transcript_6173/m.9067 type:complete len:541 (+) Transcript_6173:273-1895(+)|eukprot:CAMPEP_0194117152 /NCGR_PEP_ID=MMETSP0150-20130528/30117_1 /TAXON_ID=122233 /ORGANISM="Chaetoceros debilis, Strain MM31A-1" /LENGTH=540 /DNA_ID=CAMNT_0038808063 /DNA_START=200 /DNA_END=1822 /DNA_ORIENTATION=-